MRARERYEQHVLDLCEQYEISIYWIERSNGAVEGHAIIDADEINISPIRGPVSYAVALHEIGHIRGKHQRSWRVLVRERWAWRWAVGNAIEWTKPMERCMKKSLAWYEQNHRWTKTNPWPEQKPLTVF